MVGSLGILIVVMQYNLWVCWICVSSAFVCLGDVCGFCVFWIAVLVVGRCAAWVVVGFGVVCGFDVLVVSWVCWVWGGLV